MLTSNDERKILPNNTIGEALMIAYQPKLVPS